MITIALYMFMVAYLIGNQCRQLDHYCLLRHIYYCHVHMGSINDHPCSIIWPSAQHKRFIVLEDKLNQLHCCNRLIVQQKM